MTTQTKPQHMPTPLPANGNRTQGEWLINPDNRQEVIGQHGIVITQCETFDLPTEETAHNAAFIVKCVNAHDEMRLCIERIVGALSVQGIIYADDFRIQDAIAILAKVQS